MDTKALQIVAVANEVFMKYGIRSVSMDDITRELGISKKTLYRYFSNKADLLDRVLKFRYAAFENMFQALNESDQGAIDDLFDFSKIINEHLRSINPVFDFDLKKYYPANFRIFLDKMRGFAHQFITENIRKGISEGVYRQDLNIDLVSRLYVNKLEDLHRPDIFENENVSPEEVFRVMFENHIRGISNDLGIKYFEKKLARIRT